VWHLECYISNSSFSSFYWLSFSQSYILRLFWVLRELSSNNIFGLRVYPPSVFFFRRFTSLFSHVLFPYVIYFFSQIYCSPCCSTMLNFDYFFLDFSPWEKILWVCSWQIIGIARNCMLWAGFYFTGFYHLGWIHAWPPIFHPIFWRAHNYVNC
jgi:hypothetical protein